MQMLFPMIFYVGTLVAIIATAWLYNNWLNPKCNGTLPPGSMGLPILGETLQFFASSTTFDIHPFVKERMRRYGSIFKTNLVGQRIIVSTDAELNYLIFQREGELFESWYPDSFTDIFGRENIGTMHGFLHKHLKNMVSSLFGPEGLKKMLQQVEQESIKTLERWSSEAVIEVKESTAQMIFELTAKKLISCDSEESCKNLRERFEAFTAGLISFPINIPRTTYNKCMQGRKEAMILLEKLLQERRERPRNGQVDFFDYVLEELQRKDTLLTESIALDLMFVLLFASFETTSLALTTAIKFLADHPLVLKALIEEHEAIIRKRDHSNSKIIWSEYKSMKFTFQVINESIRLANIAPGIFRKAMTDIKFKDYTIPCGWAIMVCPPAVHLNPKNYTNPLDFDPWRWEAS